MKLLFPALFFLTFAGLANAVSKPNVILLLVDDLKPTLGCYGDEAAKTPYMDALAERGMRFDLAYCNQAVCAPSRFTLMLGSHSTSTGLYGLGNHLRRSLPDAVTMPQFFAKHGYRAESLGKIFHVGHGNLGDPDSFFVPHFHDKVIEYLDPASTHGGKLTREEALFTNRELGRIRQLPRGAAFEAPVANDEDYADGRVAAETVRRLEAAAERRRKDGTPFFIAAGFVRPHLPFSAPKKYWDLFDPAKLPMPEKVKPPEGAPSVALKRGGEIAAYFPVPPDGGVEEELARKLIHGYYASATYADAQIGKVLDALDQLKLAEDTIVVLWGDHGWHLGDLGIWTKHTNYEQANRIPLLFVAPGVTKPGSATQQLAESVDLFPTLAELAGLPAPDGPQPIDGVSLVSVLENPRARVRDHAYHVYPRGKLGRAIRTERHRLVQWRSLRNASQSVEYELYDYADDPVEHKNLAAEKPELLKQLLAKLAKYPTPVGANWDQEGRSRIEVPTPLIANKSIRIVAEAKADRPRGVVVAQGGREHGYALHFVGGRLAFDVRVNGKVHRLIAEDAHKGKLRLEASLDGESMTLTVNGKVVRAKSPGLISVQPKDGLNVGYDDLSAAGDYVAPNPFRGEIVSAKVRSGDK